MREFEGAALIARRRYPRFAMRPTDRSLPCCSVLVRRLVRPRRRAVACTRSDRTGQCRPPVFRAFMTLGFFTLVRVTLIIKDRRYSTQVLCKRLSANRPTGGRCATKDCAAYCFVETGISVEPEARRSKVPVAGLDAAAAR